jgi:hypothetical protein
MGVGEIISLWLKNSATLLIKIMQASPVLLQHILASIGLITVVLVVVCLICLLRCLSGALFGFCCNDWCVRRCGSRQRRERKGTERSGKRKTKTKPREEEKEENTSLQLEATV